MRKLPTAGMPVQNLETSVNFYVTRLGFTLDEQSAAEDVACILDCDGDTFLLAGPRVADIAHHLAEKHYVFKPDDTLSFRGGDLDTLYAQLRQRGSEDAQLIEKRWGDRILSLRDPDGYQLGFISFRERTPAEGMALYMQTVDELEAALTGLSATDIDLRREPGSWTIRQIVHHLADSDILFLPHMQKALREPGNPYTPNWPAGNDLVSEPYYTERPIASSVVLYHATHEHVGQLASYIPDAWERSVKVQDGEEHEESFGTVVTNSLTHALEHIDEINEIRRMHGK
ncbi:MAG: DinB family protein [Chloroflexota bacterium]|nr:DinB family protein [Chloroflexota bacterium]